MKKLQFNSDSERELWTITLWKALEIHKDVDIAIKHADKALGSYQEKTLS